MTNDVPALTVDREGVVTLVRLHGEIDISSVGALEATLKQELASEEQPTVLDLSDTAYLDSAGVRMLLVTVSSISARGGRIVVACPVESRVRRVVEVSGVREVSHVFDTVDSAVDALTATGPTRA